MTPYHVAKLVEWAGTLRTRKRLQKVVYLLQAAGCRALDADFILHHYGPYSPEVASLADQMVTSGLLMEKAEPNQVGFSYSYELTETARQAIKGLEEGPQGHNLSGALQGFEGRAGELLKLDVRDLEYAATLVYFFKQTRDWEQAKAKTCAFKKLPPDGEAIGRAMEFANRIVN